MVFNCVFALLVIAVIAYTNADEEHHLQWLPDGRIVGGKDTDIKETPYQAQLLHISSAGKRTHLCGGSIIGLKWVLTAAHCIVSETLEVKVGSSSLTEGGKSYKLESNKIHPLYNRNTIDYDFAVLKVKGQFTESSKVRIIPLASVVPEVGKIALVSGWGILKEGGQISKTLQSVKLPIFDHKKCNQIYRKITDRMVCAGYDEGGKDSCSGDSGGPLVVDKKLVGVVSWGAGCARRGYPGVYASVPSVLEWIKKETNE